MGTGLRFAFLFPFGRRSCRGGAFAGDLCAAGHGVRDFDFPKTFSSYFSIFDMIARVSIGNVGTEIGLDHWPNIYTAGVAVLMFFLLYLGSRKITFREKAVYCSMLVSCLRQLFSQCAEFYLAWVPLSQQPSLPSVLYLYCTDAVFVLPRLYSSAVYVPEIGMPGVLGAVSFVLLAEKLVDNPNNTIFPCSMRHSCSLRHMEV